ncbi:MAG: hypothetical protein OER86_08625, partial [Phycisphaerae bacterium]|nr:hypothetical protein [Phycisphaerae bacterium]
EPPAPPAPEPPAGNQLLQQAMKLRAQQLVTEAGEAREQGHYNRASQLYRQAQQIDPGNGQARDGASDVAALLARDVGGGEGNLVTDYAGVVKLRAEQAKAHFTRAIEEAQKHAAAGRYAEATDAVSLAKAIIDTRRQYLAEADYTLLNKQALDLGAEISKAGEMARLGQIATQERNIRTEETARRLKAETERRSKVQQLLQRAVDLRRELDYEQSVDLLDQVLFLEPNNIAAQAMKEMIEDTIIYRNTRTLLKHRGLQIARHSVENLEATIPYTELIQYPPDWPQLTVRRRALLGEAAGESEANRQTLEKLKQPIPVSFDANRFENVVEYLRNVTGVNFFVNWKALEGAGIEPGTQVTLNLANVPGDKALRLILDQVGGDLVPLGYSVDEGVVTISTTESLGKNTAIRTYDIRDLLVQIPDFGEAPDFDLQSITQGGDSGGGGGGGLFSGEGDDAGGLSRGEMVESIMQLTRDTVDADSWRSNGGLVSSMSELNGSLIINTTSQNHRAILSLLGQLRETRALSINVEARFLLVDQNFLDEIGIDLDLTGDDWNIAQDSLGIASRPNTGVAGSFGELGADITGGAAQSLTSNLAGTFLNDVQVTLLIRATQANRRTVNVSAPRLTFFNGQRAYVMIATQLAYVSDLDPIVGTRAAAFDPVISVVSSGVILDVEGTVSADRRYVTLSARPSLARILRLRGILVVGPAVDPGDDDVDPDAPADIPDVSRGLIEAPELELTTIRTTVSVPDKGTLLMGGQRIAVDIDVEAGVPVLSKVPVLNRLFTNRATVKDERTLLILIKPTILMQSEKEQQLFPGMDQSPSLFGGNRPPAPAP